MDLNTCDTKGRISTKEIRGNDKNTDQKKLKEKDIENISSLLSETNKKKGFRIDDILFSVTKTVEQDLYVDVNSGLSPQSLSPLSVYSSSNDDDIPPSNDSDIPRLSPVSFIERSSVIPSNINKRSYSNKEENLLPSFLPNSPARLEGYMSMSKLAEYENDCAMFPNSPSEGKKPRTSFTPDQIQTLEDSFNEKRYLNHNERMILANELNLTDCQIKTWFQNRRMKMKRQYKEAVEKGYLVPFHPYPFPRYSRLTPAHFASAPGVNSRHFLPSDSEEGGNNISRNVSSCTCCIKESRVHPHQYHDASMKPPHHHHYHHDAKPPHRYHDTSAKPPHRYHDTSAKPPHRYHDASTKHPHRYNDSPTKPLIQPPNNSKQLYINSISQQTDINMNRRKLELRRSRSDSHFNEGYHKYLETTIKSTRRNTNEGLLQTKYEI